MDARAPGARAAIRAAPDSPGPFVPLGAVWLSDLDVAVNPSDRFEHSRDPANAGPVAEGPRP